MSETASEGARHPRAGEDRPAYRRCHVCGAEVPADHAFCGACGARMPESMVHDSDEGLLGRVIDNRYRIVRKVGQGGMGAVFLAEHVGIGKRLAVKVVRADLRGNPELVKRFRREAMAVSRLTDAHTITVFDFGLWKGLAYLVMEYLSGTDLGHVLDQEARLSSERVITIAQQMCSSLAEAHTEGLVHRDLKPENIFLSRTTGGGEFVKVLDFGLAKMMTGEKSLITDPGLFETQAGAIVGTPHYMSPEQISGEPLDGRTDLYAMGALLYRMTTGRLPYMGNTPMDVLQGHLSGELDPFRVAAPGIEVDPHLEALVRRLMARRPEDRPDGALHVARALESVKAGQPPSWAPEVAPAEDKPQDEQAPETSSSGRLDTPWTASFSEVGGPSEPGLVLEDEPMQGGSDLLTRGDFDRYERRLRWRARVRNLLLTLLMAGAIAGLIWALVFRTSLLDPTREHEPNEDSTEATPIKEGITVTGHIGKRRVAEHSDWDVYSIDVPGDRKRLGFELTEVPGMDLVVEVFNDEGTRLFRINDHGEGQGEALSGRRIDESRVYLLVMERWIKGVAPTENSTDAYQLTVRFTAEPHP